MGSEEIVRERYPHAEARHYDAVHQIGQKAATQPEHWAIYHAGGLGNQPIATGPTEEAFSPPFEVATIRVSPF